MSEFELSQRENGGMRVTFVDCFGLRSWLAEFYDKEEPQVGISTRSNTGVFLNRGMVKGLLPYFREFAETGSFGRRPIQRAFLDPSIMQLAETDPLLASVRDHILQLTGDDDMGAVHALVRLLVAYSETVTEAVRQVNGLREGLQETVFAKMEVPSVK